MIVAFRKSFSRDLKKIKERTVLDRVSQAIAAVEAAAELGQISDLKKISGAAGFYRIRVGEYRLGIVVEEQIVESVRCLPRKDLYRFFP